MPNVDTEKVILKCYGYYLAAYAGARVKIDEENWPDSVKGQDNHVLTLRACALGAEDGTTAERPAVRPARTLAEFCAAMRFDYLDTREGRADERLALQAHHCFDFGEEVDPHAHPADVAQALRARFERELAVFLDRRARPAIFDGREVFPSLDATKLSPKRYEEYMRDRNEFHRKLRAGLIHLP